MSEARGRDSLAPPEQSPLPDALVEMRLMTQVLVAELEAFGTASGGPKRQPVFPAPYCVRTPAELQWRSGWTAPATSAVLVATMSKVPGPAWQFWTLV